MGVRWVILGVIFFRFSSLEGANPSDPCPLSSLDGVVSKETFRNAKIYDSQGLPLAGELVIKQNRVWFYPSFDEPLLLAKGEPLVLEPTTLVLPTREIVLKNVTITP